MKRQISLLLAAWLALSLTACGQQPVAATGDGAEAWTFPTGPAPETEYERAFWYGFAAEDEGRDKGTVITEEEMVGLLTRVIAASGGDVEGWS